MASGPHRGRWLGALSAVVDDLGLSALVAPILDLLQAFGPVGALALRTFEPLFMGLGDTSEVDHLATLLDRPDLIARFQVELLDGEG